MGHHDGGAVGRRLGGHAHADHAGDAAAVVDDDLLAEMRRHALGDDAGHRIDPAAGRERHDQRHRPPGRGLRLCARRETGAIAAAAAIIPAAAAAAARKRRKEGRLLDIALNRKPEANTRTAHRENTKPPASGRGPADSKTEITDRSVYAVAFHMRQPRHFVLQLQLATLEFRQSEIVYRRMLEGFGELVLEHPMPLYEFGKMRRCRHGSSWGGQIYSLTTKV